jgi:hypothetical protein
VFALVWLLHLIQVMEWGLELVWLRGWSRSGARVELVLTWM